MQHDKKDFLDPITGGSLLSIFGIGIIEIFKATIGFFTWLALKEWWDSRQKGKNGTDREVSGEEQGEQTKD